MYVHMAMSVSLYICFIIDLCHVVNGHGRRDTYLMSSPEFTGVSLALEYATNIPTPVMTAGVTCRKYVSYKSYHQKCLRGEMYVN